MNAIRILAVNEHRRPAQPLGGGCHHSAGRHCAGSAAGGFCAHRYGCAGALDVSVVSRTSLSVYLLPLIALLLAFDALVGEFERGTMLLLLSYPVARWQVVMGKFSGHTMIC